MKKNIIDNQDFVNFVNGQLSHQELVDIERKLIDAEEAISSLQASIVNYRTRYLEAEDILGADEIFFRRKAINDSLGYSIVSNPLNNHFMTLNLNQQESAKINSILDQLNETLTDDNHLIEQLCNFYLKKCPGATPSEAKEVINGLKNGIIQFNENLSKVFNEPEQDINYIELIDQATKEMSLNEKYDFLINYLVAIQVISAENYDLNLNVIEGINELKGKVYHASGEVTEEMISELMGKIEEVMNNSILIFPNTLPLETLVNNLAEGRMNLEEFAINSKEDMEQKLKLALVTYIAYKQKIIPPITEEDIMPESIGIGIAAGIEEAKIIEQTRKGEKEVNIAVKIIKIIGGVALFTGLFVAGVWVTANIVSVVSLAFMSLVGTSVLGTIISCATALFLVGIPVMKEYGNISEAIMNGADKLYDLLAQEWIPKAWQWTIQQIQEFVKWISNKQDQEKVVVVNNENSSEQIAIQ